MSLLRGEGAMGAEPLSHCWKELGKGKGTMLGGR